MIEGWSEVTMPFEVDPEIVEEPDGSVVITWRDSATHRIVAIVTTMDALRKLNGRALDVMMLSPRLSAPVESH